MAPLTQFPTKKKKKKGKNCRSEVMIFIHGTSTDLYLNKPLKLLFQTTFNLLPRKSCWPASFIQKLLGC